MSVWRIPVEGGAEVKVLDSVHPFTWTLRPDGIYFFTSLDKHAHRELRLYEFATGNIKKILMTERELGPGVAVCEPSVTMHELA
jgi:hypothetical protein